MAESLSLSDGQQIQVISPGPEVLEMEATWSAPGGPPPKHLHPHQDEEFEVLSGQLDVEIGAERRVVTAGEMLVIPRGTPHRMWNAGPEPATARWRVTPAMRTLEMFRVLDGRPSGLGKILMLLKFRNEFRLAR